MNKMTHGPCVLQGKAVYFVLVPAPTEQGCLTRNPRPVRIPHHEFCCLSARVFPAKPSRRHLDLAPNSHSLVPFPNCYRIFLRRHKFTCLGQSSKTLRGFPGAHTKQESGPASPCPGGRSDFQCWLYLYPVATNPWAFLRCFQDTKSP